jgi:hypothetical protein
MDSAKPTRSPVVQKTVPFRQPPMSIMAYVDLVDRLLDDNQFTLELKKPQKPGNRG